MENLISSAMIFLILSLISEKLANLIKIHWIKRKPTQTKSEEERRIHFWAVVSGWIVAFFLNVNIFEIVKNIESLSISPIWEVYRFGLSGEAIINLLKVLFGSLLTGFFLSLGSKFWHDLLDLLLMVKNAKRLLADPSLRKEEISNTIVGEPNLQDNLIESAYKKEKKLFNSIEGINGVEIGEKLIDGEVKKCLVFHVENKVIDMQGIEDLDKKNQFIPPHITLNTLAGEIRVYTDVVQVGKTIPVAGKLSPVTRISNEKPLNKNTSGVLGSFVKKNDGDDEFILTCFHCLADFGHDWNEKGLLNINLNDSVIRFPVSGSKSVVAELTEAIHDDELDVALAKPVSDLQLIKKIPLLRVVPNGTYSFSKNDKGRTEVVFVRPRGRSTGVFQGTSNKKITYTDSSGNETKRELKNLIKFSSNGSHVAKPGDSGALLMLANGSSQAVGVVVATDDKASYAMPIETIFRKLKVNFS